MPDDSLFAVGMQLNSVKRLQCREHFSIFLSLHVIISSKNELIEILDRQHHLRSLCALSVHLVCTVVDAKILGMLSNDAETAELV